jgi:hypothetical protein
VRGEDGAEELAELTGEIMGLKLLLLFDLEGAFGYDCCWMMNFGWEWDRRSGLDEK